MTNKERAMQLIGLLNIKQEALRNAWHWEFPRKDIKVITDRIHKLQDELVAMIPD